jgi:hypothetical protein
MIKDYSASKSSSAKAASHAKPKPKWPIPALLLLVLAAFLFFALQTEFNKMQGLKENRRLLLLRDNQPLAVLSFKVDEKQLFITDLRGEDFALSERASQSRGLAYSFALGVILDEVHDYQVDDLSKESLLSFFRNQRPYYVFLKHPNLLVREQRYSGDLPSLSASFFDCPVALINTTAATGLASNMAKVLEQSAFSVVKKDSNRDNLSQTKILYDKDAKACAGVLKKLGDFLPFSLLEADQAATKLMRSSIVIYIGEDLAQSLVAEFD